MKTGKVERIFSTSVIVILIAILAIMFYKYPTVPANAIASGDKFKMVYSQKMDWGQTRIIVDTDTRIGYILTLDAKGQAIGFVRDENVAGEPQRYKDDGSIIPRIDQAESWRWVSSCGNPDHIDGEPLFPISRGGVRGHWHKDIHLDSEWPYEDGNWNH